MPLEMRREERGYSAFRAEDLARKALLQTLHQYSELLGFVVRFSWNRCVNHLLSIYKEINRNTVRVCQMTIS